MNTHKKPPSQINDWLKFNVAKKTIDERKERFKKSKELTSYRDNDLVALHDKLLDLRNKQIPEAGQLYDQICSELCELKDLWLKSQNGSWADRIRNFHRRYQRIQPYGPERVGMLVHGLYMPEFEVLSIWALLKASTLFKISEFDRYCRKFVWHMCGTELCEIKCRSSGASFRMTGLIHGVMRLDKRVVARLNGKLIGLGGNEPGTGNDDVEGRLLYEDDM